LRLAIQGVGVVGGFGCGIEALSHVLATQESRPQSVSIKTAKGMRQMPAFLADTARIEDFVDKKALRRVDHYSKLALLGAFLALENAGQSEGDHQRMGMVIATGYGASRTTFAFLDSFMDDGDKFSSPTHFSNSVHNAAMANVSMLLGITGPGLTVSQFEMSVPSALVTARNWLKEGRVDSVLLGAIDEYCDVLGYCWRRFFGGKEDAAQGMNPLSFNLQSAIPGEGTAFFLLTREENGGQSPYGFIEDIEIGRCGRGKLEVPEEVMLIIGADGHKKCGSYYKRYVPGSAPVACYTPLYGSLPVGPAFDMAIAALSIKNKKVFPSPNPCCDKPGIKIVSNEQALGNRPICCLKIGGGGEWGKMTLGPFPLTRP
jgi:3-oxoacyl-[acyl-carrier-protein] synthase II